MGTGTLLYWALKKNDVSQYKLAKLVGVSKSTVCLWVSGKHEPREKYHALICEALNINSYLEIDPKYKPERLKFLFIRYNLDPSEFDQEAIEKEMGFKFLEIVGKYRKGNILEREKTNG